MKTKLLQPGETEEVHLEIEPENYAFFEADSSSWVIESGTYRVHVGVSSNDIRWTDSLEVGQKMIVKKVSDALAPDREIQTFHR